jgi:vacuolar-type H+-ATPase subunit F/Vma7
MKIVAICDESVAIGLELAGVHEVYVPDGDEKELFQDIVNRDDVGILFITEDVAKTISRDLKEFFLQGKEFPIIVEIPGKEKVEGYVDNISALIKRAVGISVERRAL